MLPNKEINGVITGGSKQAGGIFTRWLCILRSGAIYHGLTPRPGKSERGVQRDGPNEICSDHAQNERHVHEIKKRKDKQGIREKTAADDELQMPSKIQKRIRRPALRMALPDFQ